MRQKVGDKCRCADALNFHEPQPDCRACGGTGTVKNPGGDTGVVFEWPAIGAAEDFSHPEVAEGLIALLAIEREIWGEHKLCLDEIAVRLGVTFGDICRIARAASKDDFLVADLKRELGNVIASTVRWCDDLGLDPAECVELALRAQAKFAKENERR